MSEARWRTKRRNLSPHEVTVLREKAIEKLDVALAIADQIDDEVDGFLIELALDHLRAETSPDAIDDAPASHSKGTNH